MDREKVVKNSRSFIFHSVENVIISQYFFQVFGSYGPWNNDLSRTSFLKGQTLSGNSNILCWSFLNFEIFVEKSMPWNINSFYFLGPFCMIETIQIPRTIFHNKGMKAEVVIF